MENGFGDFNPAFVYIAYALVWIVFFTYLYYLSRRQAEIRSEIDTLKNELQVGDD